MKKLIACTVIVLVAFSACRNKKTDNTALIGVDTSHLYNSSLTTDTGAGSTVTINGVTYVKAATEKPVVTTTTTATKPKTSNTSSSSNNPATTTTTTTTTKKKGWSNAAKGTVIGAGTGALTGALISKKKGKGAIIGGLIGAGAGYVIGRQKDKKNR